MSRFLAALTLSLFAVTAFASDPGKELDNAAVGPCVSGSRANVVDGVEVQAASESPACRQFFKAWSAYSASSNASSS
jgi:hypothetical protein